MSNENPSRPDLAQMDEEVERMIRQTPPEVIQKMYQRLQELRRTPASGTSRELLRKRAG
jgi:hypothetical protein